MKLALALLIGATGCQALLALDRPVLEVDASKETHIDAAPDTLTADSRSCPPANGCTAFTCSTSSSCYYLCGAGTAGGNEWPQAQQRCTMIGGNLGGAAAGCLVTIDSQAEQDCIVQNATFPGIGDGLWIGYAQQMDAAEPLAGWAWTCGGSQYTAPNWGLSEPNDTGGAEQCAGISAGGAWFDAKCTDVLRYVCELP